MSSFEQALRLAGLMPSSVVPDGKIRRCRTEAKPTKRNGWYVLHPDGRGSWGDWTTGSGEALGHWKDETASTREVDPAVQARLAAQRDAERSRRIDAMRSARRFWDQAKPLARLHPYIGRKGLAALGCAGLREHDGHLVVPVWHGDKLISIQTIHPDGTKRFWPGAPVKAGAFVMDRPGAALTCVCEGLATGLAIYQCVRHARVIVAFDAGNLAPVVDRIRPSGSVVVVADNDHGTQARRGVNPGIEKATNAAELIGAGVAWPEGVEGTDIADMLKELGPQGAKRIERLILAKAKYVMRAPVS